MGVMPKAQWIRLEVALRHAERAQRAATEFGSLDVRDCDEQTPPADLHLAHAVADLESAIHHLDVLLKTRRAPKP